MWHAYFSRLETFGNWTRFPKKFWDTYNDASLTHATISGQKCDSTNVLEWRGIETFNIKYHAFRVFRILNLWGWSQGGEEKILLPFPKPRGVSLYHRITPARVNIFGRRESCLFCDFRRIFVLKLLCPMCTLHVREILSRWKHERAE